jgi:hypothetical protein
MFNISSEFVHALISQLVTQRKGSAWEVYLIEYNCGLSFFLCGGFNSLTFQINQLSHERFGLCEVN